MSGQPRLGLYLHIPFCERKCPYCDFNTYAGLQSLFSDTVEALCQEMGRWRTQLDGRSIATIFIGGGTPTVLDAKELGRLFAAIHANFAVAADCEITCEANPGTVDRAKFATLRGLGVNRLSMGVQSFQPDELQFLGRIHTVEDVYLAYAAARAAGFENINLDFIFGLPEQTSGHWEATLTQALALEPEHLSLYSLIVEPDTPLYHWVQTGQVAGTDDDLAADLYEMAIERLAGAGYAQYEVSNWARNREGGGRSVVPDFACQHNLIYWRNDDYLGIGPGAHSHLRRIGPDGELSEQRWGNRKPVPGYVNRIRRGEPVEAFSEEIDPRLAMGETMMLGLRLVREGVSFERFADLHHCSLRDVFGRQLADFQKRGLVSVDGEHVRLTPQGLMIGNQVFAAFLPD
jgi:oxygen-independent coproporphyrinogen III oxidase